MKTIQVVTLSPVLPYRNPDNAGTKFVHLIQDALHARGVETLVVAPAGHITKRAENSGTAPPHVVFDGARFCGGSLRQRWRALAVPLAPPCGFAVSLLTDPILLRKLRKADVVDFQWEQTATLLPIVLILNRRARTVVTLHDVFSQRAARNRELAQSLLARARWSWALLHARILEHFVVTCADAVLVLSEKDRGLLASDKVSVLHPPLAVETDVISRRPQEDRLLFVAAMYRDDNREGLRWFLERVWPQLKSLRPGVRLDVAGAGPGEEMELLVNNSPDVHLLYFVDDLEPLYASASAVVVPLRRGAGVKFKVVDAIVRGVPVVTTTVGAEGIGDPSWFAGVCDDPSSFCQAVIHTLLDPAGSTAKARATADAARSLYGLAGFREEVAQAYGLGRR